MQNHILPKASLIAALAFAPIAKQLSDPKPTPQPQNLAVRVEGGVACESDSGILRGGQWIFHMPNGDNIQAAVGINGLRQVIAPQFNEPPDVMNMVDVTLDILVRQAMASCAHAPNNPKPQSSAVPATLSL